MSQLSYKIFRSKVKPFDSALQDLFLQIEALSLTPLRLLLFCKAKTNEEYIRMRDQAENTCANHFPTKKPLVAVVAQAPFEAELAIEVTYANTQITNIAYYDRHIILDNQVLLTGAIYSSVQDSIGVQSDNIFSQLTTLLSDNGYKINDIVRQWNYIERITHISPEGQNYQQFNDARSRFYAQTEWPGGYPAATGIGTACGGAVVIVDAIRNSAKYSRAIDNPLQISAHAYSQQVLIDSDITRHKSTPKFERAREVNTASSSMVYISGTAAIRGEKSHYSSDALQQLELTMENIAYLVSPENPVNKGYITADNYSYSILRIYLKRLSNWPSVKQWITENYTNVETLCVEADICRDELLVEIEGIANKVENNNN